MSLSLSRRVTRVALLTAAGAASVVATAGAASAAALPATHDGGGLSGAVNSPGDLPTDSLAEGRLPISGGGLPTDGLAKGGLPVAGSGLPTDGLMGGLPIGG